MTDERHAAMEGYGPSTYGDRFADVYDDWYDDPTVTEACVSAVWRIATDRVAADPTPTGHRPPRILELGAGTGRLALPLAAKGAEVVALDASEEMLDRLRAKPGAAAVAVVTGDMAGPLPDGPFDVVLIARNTLFNLTTEAAQRACLTDVARVLAPAGRLVVEAFVPTDEATPTSSVSVRRITADRVVLMVDRHDPVGGQAWSSMVDISADGIVLRPCQVRYLRPLELDALGDECGLRLDERRAGWDASPFDDGSDHHVTLYAPA